MLPSDHRHRTRTASREGRRSPTAGQRADVRLECQTRKGWWQTGHRGGMCRGDGGAGELSDSSLGNAQVQECNRVIITTGGNKNTQAVTDCC